MKFLMNENNKEVKVELCMFNGEEWGQDLIGEISIIELGERVPGTGDMYYITEKDFNDNVEFLKEEVASFNSGACSEWLGEPNEYNKVMYNVFVNDVPQIDIAEILNAF